MKDSLEDKRADCSVEWAEGCFGMACHEPERSEWFMAEGEICYASFADLIIK
ncbi:MAG: hypothetical protein QF755_05510 [Candidatus Peribacteraceae bacterium]|nr:hypothetical protein [Candidatus Peribacteraceae bacterium]